MWRNFRRRSHTRVISQKLSRCVPRNRSLHLLGLCPTQCMQIFSRLGHQPRGSKGRKRQSPPKIRPHLFRRRRRPPRICQSTGLTARSNKIDADEAGPHHSPSDSNQTEWHGPGSRSPTLEYRRSGAEKTSAPRSPIGNLDHVCAKPLHTPDHAGRELLLDGRRPCRRRGA